MWNIKSGNKLRFKVLKFIFVGIAILILTSCVPVKGYQKAYLNDRDMKLDARLVSRFELNFQAYREGASGANGGKTGGGCGCN